MTVEQKHVSRRDVLRTAAVLAVATGMPLPVMAEEDEPGVIGHGRFRYRPDAMWARENNLPLRDCHEMVQVPDGRLFMLGNEVRNNMIILDKAGRVQGSWGTEFPGAHGLTLSVENEEAFLFMTDHDRHQVYKVTLEGRIVMTMDVPLNGPADYREGRQFKPTEVAVNPVNGDFYVVDGYGHQWVSHFNHNGELLNQFGGRSDTDPGCARNMHGIVLDTRNADDPTLVVTARRRHQFHRYGLDGVLRNTVDVPGAQINRGVIQGEHLWFSVLRQSDRIDDRLMGTGFTCVLDAQDRVVACPGGEAPVYDEEGVLAPLRQDRSVFDGFLQPHDVCMDDEGAVYVPQWNANRTWPIKLHPVEN